VVCKLCQNFPFIEHFFLEFKIFKRIFPISSKKFSHSAKIHQEKSLFCTEFLLFFHSRFICYDHPCNFSFSAQAAPIIATGQGEPAAPTLHTHRLEQGVLEAVTCIYNVLKLPPKNFGTFTVVQV
jgi:hypothetical protein